MGTTYHPLWKLSRLCRRGAVLALAGAMLGGAAGPVAAQPNGKPIERKSDWQAWKRLLRDAGVRDVRLHDGRHTAATLLLSEGVHPRVVMEVLGHAQMRTTTDTYTHVLPALGRDAADRMGRALWD